MLVETGLTNMDKKAKILIVLASISVAGIVFFSVRRQLKIKAFAKALVGQKELSGNSGFESKLLEQQMKEVGWKEGDQWCVYFAKLVWYQKAPDWLKPKIKSSVSGSSQTFWETAQKDPAFKTDRIPKVGDMVIWQSYKNSEPLWSGHAGIVTKVGITGFNTVEGNTSTANEREGYIVDEKQRTYNYDTNNGLRLKGFVRMA